MATPPDIILVIGQSNAAGNGHPIRPVAGAERVLMWHTGDDAFRAEVTRAVEPLSIDYDGSAGVSPGHEFARQWSGKFDRDVIVVPAAWGGTGLISGGAPWQESGSLYVRARREAWDCKDKTGGRVAAILWCQGEQDSVSGVSNDPRNGYAAVAARVLSQMRTDIGDADTIIAVGSMVPDWVGKGYGTAQEIQGALASLPARLTRCVHAYGPAGTGAEMDGIHYNARGARELGRLLYEADLRRREPDRAPATPAAPSVTPTTTGARVYFTPTPGASTHEVRYRFDGGPWSDAAVTGMQASITAPDTVCVEVQVRASGPTGVSDWSDPTYAAPVLARATVLLDPSGPGPAHRGRGDQPIGWKGVAGQVPGPAQPVVDRDNGIRDAAALVFDGGQYLGTSVLSRGDVMWPSGCFSVTAIAQATVVHDGSFIGWRDADSSFFNLGVQSDGKAIAQGFDDSDRVVTATIPTDVTHPHIYQMDRWGGGVTLRLDDGPATSVQGVGPRTAGQAQMLFGAAYRSDLNATPLQFFRGRVAFLCTLPFAASTGQNAAIRRYLQARYNL